MHRTPADIMWEFAGGLAVVAIVSIGLWAVTNWRATRLDRAARKEQEDDD